MRNAKKAVLIGIVVFTLVLTMTHFLVYQRFLINEEAEQDEMLDELNKVKDRFKSSLTYSFSATKTLAFIVSEYGDLEDFDKVAKDILDANKYIDVLELTRKGVITHIYPLKGNEAALGYDVMSDPQTGIEANRAIEKKELFFAGPLTLKQGGTAIIGRFPIFKENEFWGFSVAVIRLHTLFEMIGIDTLQNSKYVFQLSKINPSTQREEFFLSQNIYHETKPATKLTVRIPDGEWNLAIMLRDEAPSSNIIFLYLFGILLAITSGIFAWHLAKQPEFLSRLVKEKTYQLAASEKYFRTLIEKSSDGIVLIDDKGKVLYQSYSAERISGYSLREMQEMDGLDLIYPDDREEDAKTFAQLAQTPGMVLNRKHRFKHKDGHYIWLEGSYSNLLDDKDIHAIVYNYHEVTNLMEAIQKSHIAQRLYQVVSRINEIITHVTNEKDLFREACTIAVDLGKFQLAWIGILDETGTKVVPQMYAGEEDGYLSQLEYISFKNPEGHIDAPTVTAIKTGIYVLCNDIANDPIMRPWTDSALSRGYRSLIALPIKKSGQVVGTFNLYASTPHFFDQRKIDLLLETTENVAFTLENLEREKIRKRAEEQITAEKTFSESIINSLPGILYIYDITGKFIRWNKNFSTISGYNDEEIAHMHPTDFFHEDEKELLTGKINDVFTYGKADVQAHFYTKDKKRIPYYFNGQKTNLGGYDYLIGMGIDITDRVSAENELIERTKEIKKLTGHMEQIREEERTRIAREIHDELGQQLTGLKLNVHWLKKRLALQDGGLQEKISDMLLLIDGTIKTIRRISSELRPGILDDLGLMAAIEWQGQEFEKRTGVKLHFSTNMNDFNPEMHLSTNIFRIYQEALTNIARHANATVVDTSLEEKDGYILLTIKDNGQGFDINKINKTSLGLIGMKERAMSFNGELHITSEEGKGTVISLKAAIMNKTE